MKSFSEHVVYDDDDDDNELDDYLRQLDDDMGGFCNQQLHEYYNRLGGSRDVREHSAAAAATQAAAVAAVPSSWTRVKWSTRHAARICYTSSNCTACGSVYGNSDRDPVIGSGTLQVNVGNGVMTFGDMLVTKDSKYNFVVGRQHLHVR